MAKNQSTTKSETQSQGTCRNIFRAFRRRVSPARPLATPSPISTNRADVLKPSTALASASNKVLIEYNHSNNAKRPEPMKPGPINVHQQQQQNQPGPKGVKFQGGYSNNTDGASNEKFTDFIDHVKNKIKANSSFVIDENGPAAGTKRATTRRDSFNDRVSHFINRAKLKRRTTTIVAGSDHGDAKLQFYTPR